MSLPTYLLPRLDDDRSARSRPSGTIVSAVGNADVHTRHFATEEDHIDANDRDALDSKKRPWVLLLYLCLATLGLLFAVMIARS